MEATPSRNTAMIVFSLLLYNIKSTMQSRSTLFQIHVTMKCIIPLVITRLTCLVVNMIPQDTLYSYQTGLLLLLTQATRELCYFLKAEQYP